MLLVAFDESDAGYVRANGGRPLTSDFFACFFLGDAMLRKRRGHTQSWFFGLVCRKYFAGRRVAGARLNSGREAEQHHEIGSSKDSDHLLRPHTLNFTTRCQRETRQIQVRPAHCLSASVPVFHGCPDSPRSALSTWANSVCAETKAAKGGKSGKAGAKAQQSAKAALKGVR